MSTPKTSVPEWKGFKDLPFSSPFDARLLADFFQCERRPDEPAACVYTGLGRWVVLGWGAKAQLFKWTTENWLQDLVDFSVGRLMLGYFSYDFGLALAGFKPKTWSGMKIVGGYRFFVPEKVAIFDNLTGVLRSNFRIPTVFSPGRKVQLSAWDLAVAQDFPTYAQSIEIIKNYLRQGESYQVNFSQRFACRFEGDPWVAFRRLLEINSSPFQAFFAFPDLQVVSNSPERLLSGEWINGDFQLSSRPIKGTAGKEPRAKKALLDSEKNRAELTMIVDLVRNDLARVARVGTVKVDEHRVMETYSHLHHTVSAVSAIAKEALVWPELLAALFPGGSITGCPKLRTMQIIEELECFPRGLYCGSAGYVAPDGSFDFNILIRTLTFLQREKRAYFNAGGGIVIDSEAESEYEEVQKKAAAIISALNLE